MIDFELTPEQKLLKDSARKFFENELRPLSADIDREGRFPSEVVSKMASMGYMGAPIPEKYGGAGLGKVGYVVLMEEVGRVNASVATILGAHCSLGSTALLYYGTERQKEKYLVPAAGGEKLISFNLSEPGAGSDAASIQTTAFKEKGSYRIKGSKMWATNGKEAGFYIVFARTVLEGGKEGGISAFIVDRDTPGIRHGREEDKMGIRGTSTLQIFYDDVIVPEENLLGGHGNGFRVAMSSLDVGRISLSAASLGSADRAIDLALAHARERVQFGRPIAEQQAIQFKFAEMGMRTQSLRYFVYNVANMAESLGPDPALWEGSERQSMTRQAAMVKCLGSEIASYCINESLQIHGGIGFIKSSEIERMYRDARISEIYEGTNEIQRLIIGRDIVKNGWN